MRFCLRVNIFDPSHSRRQIMDCVPDDVKSDQLNFKNLAISLSPLECVGTTKGSLRP
jgi:hypothetical protein